MSKISLKHSGGNVVSLNSPTSAPTSADVAFKLPNADGTNGQVLKTDGSGNLSFGADTGGKILQVVSTAKTDTTSQSSATYAAISGLQPSITPSSTSNKVLITIDLKLGFSDTGADVNLQLFRSVGGSETQIYLGDTSGSKTRVFFGGQNSGQSDTTTVIPVSSTFLDSPNTTSAVTYLVKWRVERSSTYLYLNRSGDDTNNSTYFRAASSITVMEVAA